MLKKQTTVEALKQLKKPYWLRGEIITNNSLQGTYRTIKGMESGTSLGANIGKDCLGYYYNLKGCNDDMQRGGVDAVSGAAPVVK